MSLREILHYSLLFLLYLILQILVLRNVVLLDYAFCFVYVAGVLLLPAEINRTLLLALGFLTGILVDVFYNTLGMHAAATLLVVYLRPFWIRVHLESKGATDRLELTMGELGVGGFISFLFPMIFIHHAALFFIEMSHFGMLGHTLLRITASSVFTAFLITVIQLFSRNK